MLKLLLGDPNARKLKRYQPIVSDINLLEEEVAPLSDEELRGLTTEFRGKLAALQLECKNRGLSIEVTLERERKLLDELLPQAFAVVREAGKRVLGMRHFDVQLIGGMVLHEYYFDNLKAGGSEAPTSGKLFDAAVRSFGSCASHVDPARAQGHAYAHRLVGSQGPTEERLSWSRRVAWALR